jgi:hypothetical protein
VNALFFRFHGINLTKSLELLLIQTEAGGSYVQPVNLRSSEEVDPIYFKEVSGVGGADP